MNKTLRDLGLFTLGALVGSVSTYVLCKKAFELKADLEIEDVRNAYNERLSEIEDAKSTLKGDLEGPSEIKDGESVKDIVKRLNNKPNLTDYTKFFKGNGDRIDGVSETLRDAKEAADLEGIPEEELAEREFPIDDEPYTEEEDLKESLDYIDNKLNGASRKAIAEDTPPYVIDISDYELTCSTYEKMSLLYYIADDILTNDSKEIIEKESEDRLIGDILESSGFTGNEEDVLYVRNDKIMCDFDIVKVFTPFTGE